MAWETKPCFGIVHDLLGLCLMKYPNPNYPDLQPNTRRVIYRQCHFIEKSKIARKGKEQVIYLLRATSRRQSGPLVYQITPKAYTMP